MKEVKSIEVILENCECIPFSAEQIGAFWCSDVTADIGRIACGSIAKQIRCKELFLHLRSHANEKYNAFGQQSNDTAFKRLLQHNDITSIGITYADGTHEIVFAPWNDDSEDINKYQTSRLDESKDLYLLVSKDLTIDDLFAAHGVKTTA